jgi:hypothetical protein
MSTTLYRRSHETGTNSEIPLAVNAQPGSFVSSACRFTLHMPHGHGAPPPAGLASGFTLVPFGGESSLCVSA